MRTAILASWRGLAAAAAVGLCLSGAAVAASGAAGSGGGTESSGGAALAAAKTRATLPANVTRECPAATAGHFACMALVNTQPASAALTPTDLQAAYGLTTAATTGGANATVAVVTAFDDPTAAADFASYRSHYSLPGCTTSCFTKVNQDGQTSGYPSASASWSVEASLDADMVAAICPNCQVVLVEAQSDSESDLEAAVQTAINDEGAKFVVLGFGGPESATDPQQQNTFSNDHGVVITAAAGNGGAGVLYPASSQFVTSVGGTTLTGSGTTWSDAAWSGSGFGCSTTQFQPAWQPSNPTCANRLDNDLAAVADPATGVSFFDGSLQEGGGTNVSAAIVAATYALAGTPEPDTYPAQYAYAAGGGLTSVSGGTGATGLGVPNGTAAFTPPAGNDLTLSLLAVDKRIQAGQTTNGFALQALDSGASPGITVSATGLPPGMSVSTCPVSAQLCKVTLTGAPRQAGAYSVTLTATDATSGTKPSTVTFPMNVTDAVTFTKLPASPTAIVGSSVSVVVQAASASGETLSIAVKALPPGLTFAVTAPGQITIHGKVTKPGSYTTTVTASDKFGSVTGTIKWTARGTITVRSPGNLRSTIGQPAEIQIHAADSLKGVPVSYFAAGLPPGVRQQGSNSSNLVAGWPTKAGSYKVTLSAFDKFGAIKSVTVSWVVRLAPDLGPNGRVVLARGSKCLDGTASRARIWSCNGIKAQHWTLAQDGTIRERGKCLTAHGTARGSAVVLANCTGASAQQWQPQDVAVNSLRGFSGPVLINAAARKCLDDPGSSTRNGTGLRIWSCTGAANQTWTTPPGQLQSQIAGKCLEDPGNQTANGTRVRLWQCDGSSSQQWTAGSDGTVRIHGKCLQVRSGNDKPVELETCNGSGPQHWMFFDASPFGGSVYSTWAGSFLGVNLNSAGNGTLVNSFISGSKLGMTWRVR